MSGRGRDWSEVLAWVVRLGLAAMFFYSGFVKVGASEQFLLALVPFTFLPESWLMPIALGLPWLEVLVAVGLLVPLSHRAAAWVTFGLMFVFIAVLGWALANGIIVSCSCFGQDESPSATKMFVAIVRDGLLAAVALWLALRRAKVES